MIEWCEDLDYDKYMNNWQAIATSAKHDTIPADDSLHVVGLGELTVNTKQSTNSNPAAASNYGTLEHSI